MVCLCISTVLVFKKRPNTEIRYFSAILSSYYCGDKGIASVTKRAPPLALSAVALKVRGQKKKTWMINVNMVNNTNHGTEIEMIIVIYFQYLNL